jgi:hypothetical protein
MDSEVSPAAMGWMTLVLPPSVWIFAVAGILVRSQAAKGSSVGAVADADAEADADADAEVDAEADVDADADAEGDADVELDGLGDELWPQPNAVANANGSTRARIIARILAWDDAAGIFASLGLRHERFGERERRLAVTNRARFLEVSRVAPPFARASRDLGDSRSRSQSLGFASEIPNR